MSIKHRMPHKLYAKTAELIHFVKKLSSHGDRQDSLHRAYQDTSGQVSDGVRESHDSHYSDRNVPMQTVKKILQKNDDANEIFPHDENKNIRVYIIKNPEVLDQFKQDLKKSDSMRFSTMGPAYDDYFDRKTKGILLRRNLAAKRHLTRDRSLEETTEEPDVIKQSLPKSVEEATSFKQMTEKDEFKSIEVLIRPDDLNVEEMTVPKEYNNQNEQDIQIENNGQNDEEGVWDAVTKNYKWDDEDAMEKSHEDLNSEGTKKKEKDNYIKADLGPKTEENRDKESNDGDKTFDNITDELYKENKDQGREDTWNTKDIIKNSDWDNNESIKKKKSNWDDWGKSEKDRNSGWKMKEKTLNNRQEKYEDWNKKDDDWDKINGHRGKKNIQGNDWNKKISEKKINDWKSKKNKREDEKTSWKENKKESYNHYGSYGSKNEKTKVRGSFEKKKDHMESKATWKENKKKEDEWNTDKPKFDNYYSKAKKSKKVNRFERYPPAGGVKSFGRTPIPFVGKTRLYDE